MNKDLLAVKTTCAVELLEDEIENNGRNQTDITMKYLDKAFALGRKHDGE